jgi:hypothetical protein
VRTNDIFRLCICVVFAMNMNVLCISKGWRLRLSETRWIWWHDFIIIITCFLTLENDQKSMGCTNASMMIGLSMLQKRIMWKLLRRGNPLFFCTRFIFFFRFRNYGWGRMTYFNLCICFVFAININKFCITYRSTNMVGRN